ncbi:MAG: tyrosine-type recombinase/integrase [Ruminococcus sp.]|uniref:tyrosine-type recombinase/integrase n=1 Tax=Ruminococcus sp. TaxID=41978 RepID=UPI0025FC6117|nr:tyrosine-type recombinase/integrase [Ruminococcus sp.]MCR5601553.1 tyrosine-type recombinase/integrase [Ruminococcus sp.]
MLCIKCGKEIPDNSAYCNYCGKKQTVKPKPKYHKREHGTGTIHFDKRYKKPWIALAPSSKYGKGRQYIGSYPTRNEARIALDEFIQNGRPELYNATLSDIYEIWSKTHFKGVSKSAVELYSSMWKRFKNVQEMPVRELRTAHVQEIVNAATSKSSAEIIKAMATMLCKCAMENDIIAKNYAEFVKIPKFEKKEKRIFTSEEIKKLWIHSDNKNVQAVLFMIYTGFRIGEVTAITVEDVHLEEGYIIGGEKTEAGKNRIVPIPQSIPELSAFVHDWCKDARTGKLFPMTIHKFRTNVFYAALAAAQIDATDLTPHCTRHTFASISSAAGVKPEHLQKIIGHANFNTTAEVYIHQDIKTLISEMRKINK